MAEENQKEQRGQFTPEEWEELRAGLWKNFRDQVKDSSSEARQATALLATAIMKLQDYKPG